MRVGRSVALAGILAALVVLPAQAGAQATTSTVVIHGLTASKFIPDDICGPRASFVEYTGRTNVTHATELDDGSLSFQFVDTGTYHVDFVDPALDDQESQYTEVLHFTAAPGGTVVYSLTFHDFPTGLRIYVRAHVTEVDGSLIVDRDVTKVTGCP
jgi:hypothetical protein